MANLSKTLSVTLVRSAIGYAEGQKKTVRALGLRRLGQTIQHQDTPAIRGMINKVSHLVEIKN